MFESYYSFFCNCAYLIHIIGEKEYDILDGSRLVDFKPEQTKWCGRIDTHRFSPSAQTTLGTSGNKGFDLKGIEFHLLVVDGAGE